MMHKHIWRLKEEVSLKIDTGPITEQVAENEFEEKTVTLDTKMWKTFECVCGQRKFEI